MTYRHLFAIDRSGTIPARRRRWLRCSVVLLSVTILLGLLSSIATVQAAEVLAPQDCSQEQLLASDNSDTPTSVRFINQTTVYIEIYWIDFAGDRVFYNTLAPGTSYVQLTFLTHPWVVTNAGETCIAIFMPVDVPPETPAEAVITNSMLPGCDSDTTGPAIDSLQPPPGSVIDSSTTEISAVVTDEGGGIDPNSVVMKLDGSIVAHAFTELDTRSDGTVTQAKVAYEPPQPLSDDTHTIELTVSDLCGRSAAVLPPPENTPIPSLTTDSSPSFSWPGATGGSLYLSGPTSLSFSFTGDTVTISETLPDGTYTITLVLVDADGNVTTVTWTFTIDTADPVIVCDEPDGLWHPVDIELECTAGDVTTGLDDSADANFILVTSVPDDTETGSAETNSRIVCDLAGNCATAGPIGGNKVDKKAPEITVASPTDTAYLLNEAVMADFACVDGGSDVSTCDGTVTVGSTIDTASVGEKSFDVTATDNVGNLASQSEAYLVTYKICVLYDETKAFKANASIPIRLQLCDVNDVNVSSPSIIVHAEYVTPPAELDSMANPDNNFKYDPDINGYVYLLNSKGYTPGIYTLHFTVTDDPIVHSVRFVVR